MQICGAGLLRFPFFLSNKKNQLVGFSGGLNRSEGRLPADEQRNDYIRKNDDFAKRQNWNARFHLKLFAVT